MPAIRSESTSKGANRTDPVPPSRPRGSGNLPVECPVCHKVLNRKPDLNRHMLIHSDERPRYACDFPGCTFTAIQRSNFTTHQATHTKEKNHICPDCQYATSDPAALTRHRKRQHDYAPKPRRKMPNPKKGKAPAVQPQPRFEQQYPFVPGQPLAGPSTMLVPATFTDYASSPSPSPSASGSERYPSEPYEYPPTPAEYSGYGSPSGSHGTRDDYYYPSPLNSDDEAASVGGSRGGTPSSVSSTSSVRGSPSRESSVGASSTRSRSASIPPPLFPPPAFRSDLSRILNSSNENLHEQPQSQTQVGATGAEAGLAQDATSPARCVGAQPWMHGMIQTDDFHLLVQDPYPIETRLYLPTPIAAYNNSLGGFVPNIGALPWEPLSLGGGLPYFRFNPGHSMFEELKFIHEQQQQQQQVYQPHTPSPSPPSSREGTPVFENNNESWFYSPRA